MLAYDFVTFLVVVV